MVEEGAADQSRPPVRVGDRWMVARGRQQWSAHASLADVSDEAGSLTVRAPGVLGWSHDDLEVVPARELIHPDDRDRMTDTAAGRAPDGWARFVPVEVRFLARDRRYWWTRWHVSAIADSPTVATGVDYLYPDADIGPPIGMWCWDAETDVVSWSTDLLDVYGLQLGPPASYAAFLATILEDDRDDVARHIERALMDGQPYVVTFRCPTDGGRDRWFHAAGGRCGDGSPRVVGLVKYLNPPLPRAAPQAAIGCG